MSDQNPWGTPPPGYGPPPGGPPSGPPPSGPPPGYPGGYGPYPGYGGVPPQPPRKNTGLVVALVALGLVLVVGVAIGAVLLLGGSSSSTDTVGATTTPSSASTSTSTSPSPDPSTDPTSSTSSAPDLPPSDADTVEGTGYRYELPPNPGWTEISTKDREKLGPLFDSVIAFGTSFQSAQANILIERVASGTASVDVLEPSWQKGIETSVDAKAQRVTAMEVDGEKAVAVRIKSVQGAGVSVQQVAYLVVHDGYSYTAALSYQASDDTSAEDDFDDLLGSWLWTT